MLHAGGEAITRDQLDLIQIPKETKTFKPISHYQLANKFLTISQDMLMDYTLVGENFGIARKGNQLFALLTFKGDSKEIGLSVAFRNSYDKSMSFGIAVGGQCSICDNLVLSGEIVVMKKHTKGIYERLEETILHTIYRARKNCEKVLIDSERLKRRSVGNPEACGIMGLLFGNDIVSPRQLAALKSEWLKPSHEEFQARNMWGFFNPTTEALKTSPPINIMENHARAYQTIVDIGGQLWKPKRPRKEAFKLLIRLQMWSQRCLEFQLIDQTQTRVG